MSEQFISLKDLVDNCIEHLVPRECEMMFNRRSEELVYFIGSDDDRVKIGISRNIKSRFRILQASSPVRLKVLALMPGGAKAEKALHKKFRKSRIHGEWFRLTEALKYQIRHANSEWQKDVDLFEALTLLEQVRRS